MKKGAVCSLSDPFCKQKIVSLNPSWYYTWNTRGIPGLVAVPFIPMVWGKHDIAPTAMIPNSPLLGFNEPDGAQQSNISVQTALNLWPTIQASGRRIGSPATAGNPSKDGSWLDQFVKGGGTFDFTCVHWYAPPNADSFLKEVDAIWTKYQKPIWITEFAVADWSGKFPGGFDVELVKQFMKDACAGLESRSYVERYAWKTRATSDTNMGTSALFNDDGSLTELGELYASI
jgi:hypothetical protein